MNDERIEPSVDHEYIVTISSATSESGEPHLLVHVITTREFTSFAYTLGLSAKVDLGRSKLTIDVGGLSIPSVMMPAAKGAFGEQTLRMPPDGEYVVELTRRSSSQRVVLRLKNGRPVNIASEGEGSFALFRIGELADE